MSYDHWKTTEPYDPYSEPEPLRCRECHTTKDVSEIPIQNYTSVDVFSLCGACAHDKVTQCPDCRQYLWQDEGVRVFTSPSLYCQSCAAKHPNLILGRAVAAKRDEARDDFDQVRR